MVTEVEGTQTRAIFGGVVATEVIVSLVSKMENKYSVLYFGLNDKYPLIQKHLQHHQHFYSTQIQ